MTQPPQSKIPSEIIEIVDKVPYILLQSMKEIEDPTTLSAEQLRTYWTGCKAALEWLLVHRPAQEVSDGQ